MTTGIVSSIVKVGFFAMLFVSFLNISGTQANQAINMTANPALTMAAR